MLRGESLNVKEKTGMGEVEVDLIFIEEGGRTYLANPEALKDLNRRTVIDVDKVLEARKNFEEATKRFKALLDKYLHKGIHYSAEKIKVLEDQDGFDKEYNEIKKLWEKGNAKENFEDMVFDTFSCMKFKGEYNENTVGYGALCFDKDREICADIGEFKCYRPDDDALKEEGCLFSYNLYYMYCYNLGLIDRVVSEMIDDASIVNNECYDIDNIIDIARDKLDTNVYRADLAEYEDCEDEIDYKKFKVFELLDHYLNGLVSWDGKELKILVEPDFEYDYYDEDEINEILSNQEEYIEILSSEINHCIENNRIYKVCFYEINGTYILSYDLDIITKDLEVMKRRFNKNDIKDNFTDGKRIYNENGELLIRRE